MTEIRKDAIEIFEGLLKRDANPDPDKPVAIAYINPFIILEVIAALKVEPCKDAISRQEVLETVRECYRDSDNIVELNESLEYNIPLIPSVQPKEKTEWIPIKTRPLTEKEKEEMDTESPWMYDCPLPDDDEEVEITTHWGNVTMDTFCREADGCYFENYCDDGDVLAWRHKPEPYKAESEE